MSSKNNPEQIQHIKKDQPIVPIVMKTKVDHTNHLSKNVQPPNSLAQNNGQENQLAFYFTEYKKLFQENMKLNDHLKQVLKEKSSLAEKYNDLKKLNSQQEEKRKRHRRNANQIHRSYNCQYKDCQKAYGSEGSLIQHVKIKHPAYFRSGQFQIKPLNEETQKKQKNVQEQSQSDQQQA